MTKKKTKYKELNQQKIGKIIVRFGYRLYYDPKSVTYRLHRIQRRAGVPQIRFHDPRHSFATLSIEQGMDIKTISHMLGHTDAGFTMNTYMHVTDAMQQNVADTMGELLKSKRDENEEKIIKFPA